MNTVSVEKFNELMADREFVMTMLGQESMEDVQKLYHDNGVEMTLDEVGELGETLNVCFEKLNDELDEDALAEVSGGSITLVGVTAWGVAKAVIAVGAAGLAIYKWYKSSKR